MIRVLFVCLGNICRSPMAEGVFQHMVNEAGLYEIIVIDSAGSGVYHEGEQAHRGTWRVLQEHGIDYRGRARTLTRNDFYNFDYILAMDADNLADIHSRQPGDSKAHIRLFLDYAPDQPEREVPDPYYNGRFQEVYDLVLAASKGLLAEIRKTHEL